MRFHLLLLILTYIFKNTRAATTYSLTFTYSNNLLVSHLYIHIAIPACIILFILDKYSTILTELFIIMVVLAVNKFLHVLVKSSDL